MLQKIAGKNFWALVILNFIHLMFIPSGGLIHSRVRKNMVMTDQRMKKKQTVVVTLSGRGDKDVESVAKFMGAKI